MPCDLREEDSTYLAETCQPTGEFLPHRAQRGRPGIVVDAFAHVSDLQVQPASHDLAHGTGHLRACTAREQPCPEEQSGEWSPAGNPAGLPRPRLRNLGSPILLRASPIARLDKCDICKNLHYSPYASPLWGRRLTLSR